MPEEVYEIFQTTMLKRANEHEDAWKALLENYSKQYPELADEFKLAISGKLPKTRDELPRFDSDHNAATRADSGEVIQALVNQFRHSLVVLLT